MDMERIIEILREGTFHRDLPDGKIQCLYCLRQGGPFDGRTYIGTYHALDCVVDRGLFIKWVTQKHHIEIRLMRDEEIARLRAALHRQGQSDEPSGDPK